jgi:orotidine-5'-phosphate decarboxylase
LQPNAYQALTKNLSDLAAVSKTALEYTVALLYAVFDMSQRNKKCEACSYDLRAAKRRRVRGPDSREGSFTLVAPGVGASTRNQWTG